MRLRGGLSGEATRRRSGAFEHPARNGTSDVRHRTSPVVSRGEDQAMSHNVVELSKLIILISSPDTTGVDGAVTRTKECLMTQVYPVRFTVPAEQFNRVLCAFFRASSFDTRNKP